MISPWPRSVNNSWRLSSSVGEGALIRSEDGGAVTGTTALDACPPQASHVSMIADVTPPDTAASRRDDYETPAALKSVSARSYPYGTRNITRCEERPPHACKACASRMPRGLLTVCRRLQCVQYCVHRHGHAKHVRVRQGLPRLRTDLRACCSVHATRLGAKHSSLSCMRSDLRSVRRRVRQALKCSRALQALRRSVPLVRY